MGGNDFSGRLYRLLNPQNRPKQWLVLFGLMAVSLTCIFFLGGPGTRRRLVGLKQMLDIGATPNDIKFFPENDKVLVKFYLLSADVIADTTVNELLTGIYNGQFKSLAHCRPLLETAVRRDLNPSQLRKFPDWHQQPGLLVLVVGFGDKAQNAEARRQIGKEVCDKFGVPQLE